MYEHVTFEDILQRMLDRVPSNMDKREGSVIYDAIAPAAVELQNMYIELDVMLKEVFADTASREYLVRRALERGLTPYKATYAILKMITTPNTVDVSIGSRFSLNNLNYLVIEKIKDGEYKIQCEQEGEQGNNLYGDLIPIDYIDGLEICKVTGVLIPGEDEEDTEVFRTRYFNSFDSQAFGGNIADYREKTNGIEGVGGCKVTPTWYGGGTVKLTIIDSSFNKPSAELIQKVQEIIDPVQNQGEGVGLAPIGHVVTVVGVEEVEINIETTITYASGYNIDTAIKALKTAVENYFLTLRKSWQEESQLIVRISQIEYAILNCAEVVDIENTKINGSTKNIALKEYQIPRLGDINGKT